MAALDASSHQADDPCFSVRRLLRTRTTYTLPETTVGVAIFIDADAISGVGRSQPK